MRPRAVLDLVRAPLAPTAIADVVAGAAAAGALSLGRAWDGRDTLSVVGAGGVSVLTYSFGMATNDLFDVSKDRRSASGRPLATGALSIPQAIAVAAVLAVLALGLAALVGLLAPAVALFVAVIAYNAGGKRLPFAGALLMGACRGLDLLLGACAVEGLVLASALRTPALLGAATVLTLYIACVTAISLLEDRPYRRRPLLVLGLSLALFPFGLALAAASRPLAWVNAALFAGLLADLRSLPEDAPCDAAGVVHPAKGVVRLGLRGIYFVDAGLALAFGAVAHAVAIWGLAVLGWLCMRWWVQSRRGPAQ